MIVYKRRCLTDTGVTEEKTKNIYCSKTDFGWNWYKVAYCLKHVLYTCPVNSTVQEYTIIYLLAGKYAVILT